MGDMLGGLLGAGRAMVNVANGAILRCWSCYLWLETFCDFLLFELGKQVKKIDDGLRVGLYVNDKSTARADGDRIGESRCTICDLFHGDADGARINENGPCLDGHDETNPELFSFMTEILCQLMGRLESRKIGLNGKFGRCGEDPDLALTGSKEFTKMTRFANKGLGTG